MTKQCVVCCSAVQQLDFKSEMNLEQNVEQCLLLEEICKNVSADLEGVVNSLKREWKEESFCGNCGNSLKKAVEAKRIVEETEKDVGRLELELLNKLKMRESAIHSWKRQVAKLGQIWSANDDASQNGSKVESSGIKMNPASVSIHPEVPQNQAQEHPAVCAKPEMVIGAQVLSASNHKTEPDFCPRENDAKVGNSDQATLQCDVCNKVFQSRGNFNRHRKMHTGERPHQCTQRNKAFYRIDNLNRHYGTAHEHKKPVVSSNGHLRTHQDNPLKRFGCVFCEARFFKKWSLERHITTHTQEQPYSCDTCKLSFNYSSSLRRHAKSLHHSEARM